MVDKRKFKNALLIVAHPDDEILWFSSILEEVKHIVICFMEVPGRPDWTEGRNKSIHDYPLPNLTTLDVVESEVFSLLNWQDQALDSYGLKLQVEAERVQRYRENYKILKERLSQVVQGYRTVISHNPWGEYGNEEHVQIHSVLRLIQKTFKFELWYPNYVSNKSWELMQITKSGRGAEFVERSTNVDMALRITDIYKKNRCWTWYDKWQWNANEGFYKTTDGAKNSAEDFGYVHPYNFIRVKTKEMMNSQPDRKSLLQKIKHKIGTTIKAVPVINSNK